MRISTKGRYGLRIALDIATHNTGQPRLIRDIASSQNLSEKYVGNLIVKLKEGGILKSVLGAYGGYLLNRNPAQITLLDIMEAMEGDMSIVRCVECPHSCKESKHCQARAIWSKVNQSIKQAFKDITLEDVIEGRASCK